MMNNNHIGSKLLRGNTERILHEEEDGDEEEMPIIEPGVDEVLIEDGEKNEMADPEAIEMLAAMETNANMVNAFEGAGAIGEEDAAEEEEAEEDAAEEEDAEEDEAGVEEDVTENEKDESSLIQIQQGPDGELAGITLYDKDGDEEQSLSKENSIVTPEGGLVVIDKSDEGDLAGMTVYGADGNEVQSFDTDNTIVTPEGELVVMEEDSEGKVKSMTVYEEGDEIQHVEDTTEEEEKEAEEEEGEEDQPATEKAADLAYGPDGELVKVMDVEDYLDSQNENDMDVDEEEAIEEFIEELLADGDEEELLEELLEEEEEEEMWDELEIGDDAGNGLEEIEEEIELELENEEEKEDEIWEELEETYYENKDNPDDEGATTKEQELWDELEEEYEKEEELEELQEEILEEELEAEGLDEKTDYDYYDEYAIHGEEGEAKDEKTSPIPEYGYSSEPKQVGTYEGGGSNGEMESFYAGAAPPSLGGATSTSQFATESVPDPAAMEASINVVDGKIVSSDSYMDTSSMVLLIAIVGVLMGLLLFVRSRRSEDQGSSTKISELPVRRPPSSSGMAPVNPGQTYYFGSDKMG